MSSPIVKPISFEPFSAASSGGSPRSRCRTMFSSITIASSTTKPIERMSAIIERLSSVKPSASIAEKVPRIENGSASAGMSVADPLWRNAKMTRTTRLVAIGRRMKTSETFTRSA
jgi:hypothetical protein